MVSLRLRQLYHRLVPSSIRNPIGMRRRETIERLRETIERLRHVRTRPKLPPRALLANIQLSPLISEYLLVGSRSAHTVISASARYGVRADDAITMLDFGCGSARTLRHFAQTAWKLHGCDVDRAAIAWAKRHIPFATFAVNGTAPPLPYAAMTFDLIIAISLFTHFTPDEQRVWRDELARVMKPGGLLIVSTMGETALETLSSHNAHEEIATLRRTGSFFRIFGPEFNSHGAFHSQEGVVALAGSYFQLLSWEQQGLDGFQDVSVLRRCTNSIN